MKDNFNIHNWRLKVAINELEEKQCPDCGCKMESTMCNECGYMEEGAISDIQTPFYFKSKIGIEGMDKDATFQIQDIPNYGNIKVYYYDGILPRFFYMFKDELEKRMNKGDFIKSDKSQFQPNIKEATFTSKHDDNPKLKGGQKDLPDEVQDKIVAKEDNQNNLTPLQQYIYDYEVEISGDNFANKELENIKKLNNIDDVKKYYGGYRGWAVDKDLKYEFYNLIKALKSQNLKEEESGDHEVFMAKRSLQAIMGACSKLMLALGEEERNIPGWIQDHIVNAENYIEQAAQGFHELDNDDSEYEED